MVNGLSSGLLWCHVFSRADDIPVRRMAVATKQFGDPKVGQFDMADMPDNRLNGGPSGWASHNAVCDQQIGRFQIAVHHAVIVRHLEGAGDF